MIATPIMLLGLLGLLIWGGLWGWRNLTAPIPTPEPTPCVVVDQVNVWPNDVLVNVYNGGYTRGLAERVATHLRDGGYHVNRVANTDDAVTKTIIRSAESNLKAMELVASNFTGVEFEFDERVDGTLDLLVGTEFSGYGESPLPNHPLEGAPLCKPAELYLATASPSPSPTASPATEEPAGEVEGEE